MPSPADDARTRLLDAVEADLEGVEVALERLDAGTYFTCERCGDPMGDDWLSDHPVARVCATCSATE
jgi:DnaK suppressor protein